jgi:D-alanine-D-alanine ligase-like ATP-grasp enzyme
MTTSTQLISEICQELSIPCRVIDGAGALLEVTIHGKPKFIFNNTFGLISDVEAKISLDKSFQAQVLAGTELIPLTKSYLDPFSKYAIEKKPSINQVSEDILKHFQLPFILKKNSGSEGVNVFLVKNTDEVESSLTKIFNQKSSDYDHVVIAQQYIETNNEFRIIVFENEIQFAYKKTQTANENFSSQNRWRNVKAELVTDQQKISQLQQLVDTVHSKWPIKYAGLDVIEDRNGQLWLIEINSSPALAYFIRDNGSELVKNLYRKILKSFLS